MVTPKIMLGELLVRAGVLEAARLEAALAAQQRTGARLGKVLIELGFLSEDMLVKALSKQLGVPRAQLERANIPINILNQIGLEFARTNNVCPEAFDVDTRVMLVAITDPADEAVLGSIAQRTGFRIQPTIAKVSEVQNAIARLFPDPNRSSYQAAMAASGLSLDLDPTAPPAPQAPAPVPASRMQTGSISEPPAATSDALQLAAKLDDAQRRQRRAIRALIELLVEKGVFSREEYMQLFSQPRSHE